MSGMTPVHGLSLTSDRPIANLEQMSSCQVGEVRGILRTDYRYPASCYRLSLSLDRASLLELGRESVPLAPACLALCIPRAHARFLLAPRFLLRLCSLLCTAHACKAAEILPVSCTSYRLSCYLIHLPSLRKSTDNSIESWLQCTAKARERLRRLVSPLAGGQ